MQDESLIKLGLHYSKKSRETAIIVRYSLFTKILKLNTYTDDKIPKACAQFNCNSDTEIKDFLKLSVN